MATKRKPVNISVPPNIIKEFDNNVSKTGSKRSWVLQQMMKAYVNLVKNTHGKPIYTLEFKGADEYNTKPSDAVQRISTPIKMVKVFGLAYANTLTNTPGDMPPESIHDLPEVPWFATNGHRLAGFTVEDESMSPKYTAGNTVICDCDIEVHNGNAVVIKFDDRVIIKRYKRTGDIIHLKSDNPVGKNYKIHAKEAKWVLKVIGYFAKD